MARKPKTTKRVTGHEARATKKPSERDVREAGFACPDLAAAAERLGVADLDARLKRSKSLSAAWDRGRLLRKVSAAARESHHIIEEADKTLDWPRGTLASLYKSDRVVRDLWDAGRLELKLSLSRSWIQRAHEADPKAVAAVEHLFAKPGQVDAVVNFDQLTVTELDRATGISRVQWDRWVKQSGCPRNFDGTFALARVVDWLRKWERDKATGGREAAGLNPMQAEKARMYKLQADEAEGRLLDRATVVRLFRERAARLVQVLGEARADQWSHEHEGKTAPQLKEAYLAAFRAVRAHWKEFPAEVPMPEEAKALIERGIELLLTTETQSAQSPEKGTADERR